MRTHRHVIPDIVGLKGELGDKMSFQGSWNEDSSYSKNDVVFENGWLMIANKDTDEYPAPRPQGEDFYIYEGTLTPTSTVARQLVFGTQYDFSVGAGYVNGYRINVVAGNHYEIIVIIDPEGDNEVRFINAFVAESTGWREFGLAPRLIVKGNKYRLLAIVNEPDPSPTTFSANYNYVTPQNDTVPLSGYITHSNKNLSVMYIHKTDSDSTDQSTNLATLSVGDIIQVGPTKTDWAIQAISDEGTYISVGVAPSVQYGIDGISLFTFQVSAADSLTYGKETGYWTTSEYSGYAKGLFISDQSYENVVASDDAYGIDLKVQYADIPEDWDVLAAPPSTVAGGGGGDSSNTVSNNPFLQAQYTTPSGTASGITLIANTYVDVDLNELPTNEITGASLVSGELVLPAGEYHITGKCTLLSQGSDQSNTGLLVLRNTSDDSVVLSGTTVRMYQASSGSVSIMEGRLSLTAETTFKTSVWSQQPQSNGLGQPPSNGTPHVWTDVCVWQLNGEQKIPLAVMPSNAAIAGEHVEGGWFGGGIASISSNNVTMRAFSVMDDSLTEPLAKDSTTIVAVGTTINQIYHIFAVKYDDDSYGYEVDTSSTGAGLPGNVTHKRWDTFVLTNSSGVVIDAQQIGDAYLFVGTSEGIQIGSGTTGDITVDTTLFVPSGRTKTIGYYGRCVQTNQTLAIRSVTAGPVIARWSMYRANQIGLIGVIPASDNVVFTAPGYASTYYIRELTLKR